MEPTSGGPSKVFPVFNRSAKALTEVEAQLLKRKEAEFEDDERWGHMENYMVAKKQKLLAQFKDAAREISPTTGENVSNIFAGVSIFVNGNTDPPADELKRLMMLNGGAYHIYYSYKKTTHIVANNLPYTKIVKLTADEKIVRPEWITESIREGYLLPWKRYELYPRGSAGKPTVSGKNFSEEERKESDSFATHVPPPVAHKAGDPNYLNQFFARSRLHHLSLWKIESKELVRSLQENFDGQYPGRVLLKSSLAPSRDANSRDYETVIMHIDFDCFFVSVGLLSRPHLIGKPVAVCHGMTARGRLDQNEEDIDIGSRSEVSSCSYAARKAGVKNGMYLGPAKQLCPELKMIPYEFEKYKDISTIFYQTVAEMTLEIEAISCDEMIVDCTETIQETGATPLEFAAFLRELIRERTGCSASAGLGANPLLARLATKKAKPDGQYYIAPEDVLSFVSTVPVEDIPGAGRSARAKFDALKAKTCGDLQKISLAVLQKDFGPKNGLRFYNFARGIDDRGVQNTCERKSVSVDINYGIRMKEVAEFDSFFKEISVEVQKRLRTARMLGHLVTLKLLVRQEGEPVEPAKYMGCGKCDAVNKSMSLIQPTDSAEVIAKEGIILFRKTGVDVKELRGIGVQVHRLVVNPRLARPAYDKPVTPVITRSPQKSPRKLFAADVQVNRLKTSRINREPIAETIDLNDLDERRERGKDDADEDGEHTASGTEDEFDDVENANMEEDVFPTLKHPVDETEPTIEKCLAPVGYDLVSEIGWNRAYQIVAADVDRKLHKPDLTIPLALCQSVSQRKPADVALEQFWQSSILPAPHSQDSTSTEKVGTNSVSELDRIGRVVFDSMCREVGHKFWLNHFDIPEYGYMTQFSPDYYGATLRYLDSPRVIRTPDMGTKVLKPRVMWAVWNLNAHYRDEYLEELFEDGLDGAEQAVLDLQPVTITQAVGHLDKSLKVKNMDAPLRLAGANVSRNLEFLPNYSQVDMNVLKEIPAEFLAESFKGWHARQPGRFAKELKKFSVEEPKSKTTRKVTKKPVVGGSQSLLDGFVKVGGRRQPSIGSSQPSVGSSQPKKLDNKLEEGTSAPTLVKEIPAVDLLSNEIVKQARHILPNVEAVVKTDLPRMIFGTTSLDGVHDILAWHIVHCAPDAELLGSLFSYVEQLAKNGRLSQIDGLVKSFYREVKLLEGKGKEQWVLAYKQTSRIIQANLKDAFGSTLSVPFF